MTGCGWVLTGWPGVWLSLCVGLGGPLTACSWPCVPRASGCCPGAGGAPERCSHACPAEHQLTGPWRGLQQGQWVHSARGPRGPARSTEPPKASVCPWKGGHFFTSTASQGPRGTNQPTRERDRPPPPRLAVALCCLARLARLACAAPLLLTVLHRQITKSPGEKRRSAKGSWVRTGESGVGLSEGRKGGLLHGQLVELGQLLGAGGTRELRRLLSSSTSHTKLKWQSQNFAQRGGHADTWRTPQSSRTWPGGTKGAQGAASSPSPRLPGSAGQNLLGLLLPGPVRAGWPGLGGGAESHRARPAGLPRTRSVYTTSCSHPWDGQSRCWAPWPAPLTPTGLSCG